MKRETSPPNGVFPADARIRNTNDGMPHDMGGHEGNPSMFDTQAMQSQSNANHAPAQTHNRHGGNVHVEVGKSGARPVGS